MKDKNIAALLAIFFGGFGAHKFYLGQVGSGFLYLIFCWTFIPAIIAFVEFILLAVMDQDEFNRRYNGSHTLGSGSPVVVNMLPPSPYYHPPHPPGYGYPPGQYPGHGYPGQPAPGYNPQQASSSPNSESQADVVAKLEKLNELRIAGLLTDEEFAQQKSRVLDRL